MKSLIVYTGHQVMLGKNFSRVTYGKVTTEKTGRHGRIILRWILGRRVVTKKVERNDSTMRPMANFCIHDIADLGCTP
jgi:hypothetical protein